MDRKKIVIICLIITGFFLYVVASQFAEAIFDVFNVAVNRDFGLTIPEFIGLAVAGIAFAVVINSQVAMGFLMEVVNEMLKVVYPTPKESGQSAIVVIVMVAAATGVLAIFDSVWSFFTRIVLTVGGAG